VRVVKGTTLHPPNDLPLAALVAEFGEAELDEARQAGQVGYMGRVLVQTTLPHSRPSEAAYERTSGHFTLSLTAPPSVGLPYGSIPRLVLAWLSTEAVRTKDRELQLGNSLSEFLSRLELGRHGGPRGDITRLRTQMRRLFATTIMLRGEDHGRSGHSGMMVAEESMLFWDARHPDQGALWGSTVTLSEKFFREVTGHPVPLDLAILKALRRSPLGLDIYAWLTWRMSFVRDRQVVPWQALQQQFGAEYRRARDFRRKFLDTLKSVVALYPDAQLTATATGLELLPSKPSVPRLR
jgi:hypothetical protein